MDRFQHKITVFTTDQGLSVFNINIPNYPVSTSSIWVNAGSRTDPLGKEGLSHLFEHLLFNRTKKYPNRNKRLELIESNGFYYNAFTSPQNQHYFYVHSKDTSQLALDLLIDGYTSSLSSEIELNQEKKVILTEERENHLNPSEYIWRLANTGLWGENRLGIDFYGNEQSLAATSLKDIHAFLNDNFSPENTICCFINSSVSEHDQNKSLSQLNNTTEHNIQRKYLRSNKSYEKMTFEKRDSDTFTIALSFLTDGFISNKERTLQELTSTYFAGGWISRFIQKLRVDGNFIYWIHPEVVSLSDVGYIRFYFSVNPKHLEQVLILIQKEIHDTQRGIIHNLQSHKSKAIAELQRNAVDYNWLMVWYGYIASFRKECFDLNEYQRLIEDVSEEELANFISKQLRQEKMNITYIGGKSQESILSTFQL